MNFHVAAAKVAIDQLNAVCAQRDAATARAVAAEAHAETLERRLFPGQGEGYANEVERQRVVIDGLQHAAESYKAELVEARARVAAVEALARRWQAQSVVTNPVRELFDVLDLAAAAASPPEDKAPCECDYDGTHAAWCAEDRRKRAAALPREDETP